MMRVVRLEKAKILFRKGEAGEAKKQILIILSSLNQNFKGNEVYWLYLHIVTAVSDPDLSSKALFKANQLNPSSPKVLGAMLLHYYRSK